MEHLSTLRRPQRLGEEIANAISHGLGACLGIVGTILLLCHSTTIPQIICFSLYGSSLILLYTISCLYHALPQGKAKRVFRVLDHCTIFLLILGTYTPISLLLIGGQTGWLLFGINAGCAILGIVFNGINMIRWRKISVGLYVMMGWLVIFALRALLSALPTPGVILLVAGGVSYTAGIGFYAAGNVSYAHFIWHLFVLAGSVLHFFVMLLYCI